MTLSRVRDPSELASTQGATSPKRSELDWSGVDSDERLIELWVQGRSHHTQRAYRADIALFRDHAAKLLRAVTLADVHAFAGSLTGAAATRARRLSSVKSLLAFGHRTGYLAFDVGRALRLPRGKSSLAERILSEEAVHRLLAAAKTPRNRTLLRVLYSAGLRVSELCQLTWGDLTERERGGQITVFGKGRKTRTVLVSQATWEAIKSLEAETARTGDAVFRSRNGGHLHPSSVHRIVQQAAKRAGLQAAISPHWLRHAHASHSLERGAAIHLVQATLGHASVATTGRYLHARPGDSSSLYLGV